MRSLFFLLVLTACQSQTSVTKTAKELSVTPEFTDLGVVAVGESLSEEINLIHLQGDAIQVVDIHLQNVDGSEFSTDESLQFTIDTNQAETLTVQYSPTEAGFHRATLTISTDEEKTPVHTVELRAAAVLPLADVSPTVLDFGPVAPGEDAERLLRLSNIGSVPLSLLGLDFSNTDFSSQDSTAALDPGESLDLTVRFEATDSNRSVGNLSLNIGAASVSDVALMANDCASGESALYDQDGDGVSSCGGDCADGDATIHPGATEQCDGVDNNCDGQLDEGTRCADDDGDGFSEQTGDCNDSNATINPQAHEDLSNGIDDDCDGITDAGAQDLDGDGYSLAGGDCDDQDASRFPGAAEQLDAIDNNCDGRVDEGTVVYDDDGDGYNERAGDCDDTNPSISPIASEIADYLDNNCNSQVDEGTILADDDGDGFSEQGSDCDDSNPAISPAALEQLGDGVDNNCDGLVE